MFDKATRQTLRDEDREHEQCEQPDSSVSKYAENSHYFEQQTLK